MYIVSNPFEEYHPMSVLLSLKKIVGNEVLENRIFSTHEGLASCSDGK